MLHSTKLPELGLGVFGKRFVDFSLFRRQVKTYLLGETYHCGPPPGHYGSEGLAVEVFMDGVVMDRGGAPDTT